MFELTNFSVILFLTTLINLVTTMISWQRRKSKGGYYFAWGMTAITLWTLAAGLGYAAIPLPLKVIFAKMEYLAHHSALALIAMFALSYAGLDHWLKKRWVQAFFILIPLANILLAWTNELHGWLWTGFIPNPWQPNVVVFEHGPAFLWVALTGYMLVGLILLTLWNALQKGSSLTRRQARLLFAAILIPILSNALYLLRIPAIDGVDWSSITFSISGVFFLAALHSARFLDLVPIARNTLFEHMSDGILVLDAHRHLVDFNPAARELFGLAPTHLGRPIESVLEPWPQVSALVTQPGDNDAQIQIAVAGDALIFDTRLKRLADARGQAFGMLIVFRNMTGLHQVQQALRASEERYRTVADYTYDWDYWRTPNGRIQYMSPSCERITGYRAVEFSADPGLLERIVLAEDQALVAIHKATLAEGTSGVLHQAEFRIRRRNGEIRWIAHTCQTIQKPDGVSLGLRATNRDITAAKRAEEKLQETMSQLVEERQVIAAIEERQRLARDLHDSVNQSIHSLVLSSETLMAVLARGSVDHSIYIAEHLQSSARQALKEIRLLLYQLQPAENPGETVDLQAALEFRLNNVERRAGVQAGLILEGDLAGLPPEWRQHTLRIAVEALNNSLKHAQARKVYVSLHASPKGLTVEVRDDGNGFDPASTHAGGLGLQNMVDRARLIGGTLQIDSAPGQGTRICLTAPSPSDLQPA